MTKDEALKLALETLEYAGPSWIDARQPAITAIKEALAQPAQKYRRGNRLICLETEEYCVIHISGTDRQWVKFPDSHIGVYTNEQVAELFELFPKEPEQEPVAWAKFSAKGNIIDLLNEPDDEYTPLYTTPPQRKPLSEEEIGAILEDVNAYGTRLYTFARAIEAAHGIKGEA